MKLYNHQIEGAEFILSRRFSILAYSTGTGKTITAIEAALKTNGRWLIVCPAFLRKNWESEIKAYCPQHFKRFSIYSYASLKKVKDIYSGIICDEAHYLVNPEALRTQYLHKIVKDFNPRYLALLTATPIRNSVVDLFSLLKLISYGTKLNLPHHDIAQFGNHFSNPVTRRYKGYNVTQYKGIKNKKELQRILNPYILKKQLDEVVDIPKSIDRKVNLGLEQTKAIENEVLEEMEMGDSKTPHLMTLKKKLAVMKGHHTKDFYRDLLGEVKKLVVFSEHPDALEAISHGLKGSVYIITGKTPTEVRQTLVDKFNKNPEATILCTYKASSVGLNLPTASHLVLHDYPWTFADIEQAKGRIRRINNPQRCVYHFLFASEIDKKIYHLTKQKQHIKESLSC